MRRREISAVARKLGSVRSPAKKRAARDRYIDAQKMLRESLTVQCEIMMDHPEVIPPALRDLYRALTTETKS